MPRESILPTVFRRGKAWFYARNERCVAVQNGIPIIKRDLVFRFLGDCSKMTKRQAEAACLQRIQKEPLENA